MITYFRGVRHAAQQDDTAVQDSIASDLSVQAEIPSALSPDNGLHKNGDARSPILLQRLDKVVAIVEPRTFMRECIVRYLAIFCGATVGGCMSIEELLMDDADGRPNLVVLSAAHKSPQMTLADVDGLHAGGITCPVIILVDACDSVFMHEVLRHGVRGVVSAAVSAEVAVEAIRLVLAGGTFIPPEALLMQSRVTQPGANSNHNLLTAREEQILALLRHGKQNKQIAYELSLSEGTVKVHIHNIMRKFGVGNRTQILAALNNAEVFVS